MRPSIMALGSSLILTACLQPARKENRRIFGGSDASRALRDCKLPNSVEDGLPLALSEASLPDAQRFGFAGGLSFRARSSQAYQPGTERIMADVLYGNRKVCDTTVYLWRKDGTWSLVGQALSQFKLANQALPDLESLAMTLGKTTVEPTACWYQTSPGNFAAAYEVYYEKESGSFFGVFDGKAMQNVRPSQLHATGLFSIYERDAASGTRINQEIDGLPESGYLCNSWLMAQYESPDKAVFANIREGTINNLDENSKEFQFVSAFANADRMMQFFYNIDPGLANLPRLTLHFSSNPKYTARGPFYANPDINPSFRSPVIVLPDVMKFGPTVVLKNLRTDFDVIAHELSHHIISRHLSTDSVGTRMIHEALADFFVAEKNADACIARTVCAKESGYCPGSGACLRNLESIMHYQDPEFSTAVQTQDVHSGSKILSGALRDIAVAKPDMRSAFYKLIFSSLPRIPPQAVVENLLQSMLDTDQELYAGQFGCLIQDAAAKRGIPVFSGGLDCKGGQSNAGGL